MLGRKRKRTAKVPASQLKSPVTSPVISWKEYKKWSEESMLGALKSVKASTMGWNRATTEFGVPKTTLKDHVSG